MSQQGGNQFAGSGSGVQTFPIIPYDPFPPQTQTDVAGTAPLPEPEPFVEGEEQGMSNVSYLRLILQEVIPPNASDSDTLFLDQHIVEILNRSNNVLSYAAWTGWMIKAGALAVLTDRNDGLAQKRLSQAAVAAQKQVSLWQERSLADIASLSRSIAPSSVIFRPWDRSWSDIWNQVWDVSHIDKFYLPWNVIEG